jgi:hypothetical protein
MSSIQTTFRSAWRVIRRNAPTILAGVSIASTVGATILSAKATPKAIALIEEETFRRHEELTPKEKVKTAWKCYIPAGILTVISCASTLCGTHIGLTRQAELISLVTAGENMFDRYRRKVAEKIGTDEERNVRRELGREDADKLMANHHDYYDGIDKEHAGLLRSGDLGVFDTGFGDELIWDSWNARYFRCSESAIMEAVATFNMDTSYGVDTFFPVNGFWDLLNLPNAQNGNTQGYSSAYKMVVSLNWDSDRHGYKILTFDNPPMSEFRLGSTH